MGKLEKELDDARAVAEAVRCNEAVIETVLATKYGWLCMPTTRALDVYAGPGQ